MTSPLLNDILNQPQSLAAAVDYHFGAGRRSLYRAALALAEETVLLTGMGSSLYACHALSTELAQQRIATTVLDTAEVLHYHYRAYRDAVAVLVSRSGESIETLKLLPLLKRQGTRVIGVTDVADSTLAREAELTVLIHGGQDHLVAVQSYTATVMALHLIGAAMMDLISGPPIDEAEIFSTDFDQLQHELKAVIGALTDYIPQCVEHSASWRPFFGGVPVIHLLGRGRSLASIYEGALLFNEVAKFPSVPMEAAQFRHGPVEIVDERYRAIVFAPDDQTRALNVALAHDLNRLGGQTRLIGPHETDETGWSTLEVSASLAPLVEIIPVQCAAMRLAEWRGFTPGEFRVATQVTSSETGL